MTTSISGSDFHVRPSSVGVPVPTSEIRIVDDSKRDVMPGHSGEILIKGPQVVSGYWQRGELTRFDQGWLRTGDIGRFDDEGFLYIVDRAKDLIIRGGENISTLEVEAALIESPDVDEAAVFAIPHPVLGEDVGAVIRLRAGSQKTEEELRDLCASILSPYKVPSQIWLSVDPLPRGDTGKILKRELQASYIERTEHVDR